MEASSCWVAEARAHVTGRALHPADPLACGGGLG
jgi:hypothetical protein